MSNVAPLNCLANERPVNCPTPLTVPTDEPINRSRIHPTVWFAESCFNPRTCQSMTSLMTMDIWRHLRGKKITSQRKKKKKKKKKKNLLIGPSCSPLFLYLCRWNKKRNIITGRNITRLIGPVLSLLPSSLLYSCSAELSSISIMGLQHCQNSSAGACSSPSLFYLVPGNNEGMVVCNRRTGMNRYFLLDRAV